MSDKIEILKNKIKQKVPSFFNEYKILDYSEFKNDHSKMHIRHIKCGTIFEMDPMHIKRGQGCPECNGGKKNHQWFLKKVKDLVGDEYTVLTEYITGKTKVKFRHNTCSHEFEMRPEDFINGQRCPECAKEKRAAAHRNTYDNVKLELENLSDGEYRLVSKEYQDNKTPLLVEHIACGNIWPVSLVNIRRHGCPKCCFKSTSEEEKEFLQFIKSLLPNEEIQENVKIDIHEGDIVIPSKKLVFEFNGIYWHSDIFKDKFYHINKTNEFYKKGYRTIHIFENYWVNNKDLIKERVEHILNIPNKHIYARNCNIKEISTKEAASFLNKHHIQGSTPAKTKIGLFCNNELVGVMTFGKPRDKRKSSLDEIELIRYSTSLPVIGGFSKLLKYAIKNYNYKNIITYADLSWSDFNDNVYSKNGFTLEYQTAPGYAYYDPHTLKRYGRGEFTKKSIKKKFPSIYDEKLTEFEMMDKTNLLRVWDCGNLFYRMKI